MAKIAVYNMEGKEVEKIDLSDAVDGIGKGGTLGGGSK